ncbi:hypothetical protein V475_11735 [Sphingobium baderi LL03]|jgi:hypothetical protein|uniref:Uncharacterized protein n=1 Tax=Sphingobium baderi LL03 TaxID=1114964 RepID=T0G7B1_9SPHN|nr:hypothetical protein L485_24310 [Sphingobium baderi LL03]KMS64406.1 hypothetical protein V475_11735 [Sphingobium baderi LL03]
MTDFFLFIGGALLGAILVMTILVGWIFWIWSEDREA